MVVNFRVRGISRGACILAGHPLIKKKEFDNNHKTSVPWLIMEMLSWCYTVATSQTSTGESRKGYNSRPSVPVPFYII
jgi:hypothetical protein